MQVSKPVLAIETSCDECAVAIVSREGSLARVHESAVFSQIELHRKFGGVVPEVASRNHLEMLPEVLDQAMGAAKLSWADLGAVAVTNRPGLIGALLVGVSAAKAIAYARKIPLIPVNHLEGHLHSLFIADQPGCQNISDAHLPLLVCLASGGHTNLYLLEGLPPKQLRARKISESLDDAAGEAFDKCAKLLGLPYPGGVHLSKAAKGGNESRYRFPRPIPEKDNLSFSFSGIKTSVATMLKSEGYEPHGIGKAWGKDEASSRLPRDQALADYCASIQEAIVETLLRKITAALTRTQARGFAIVGGVSSNERLRERLHKAVSVPSFFPKPGYCTDNAAMIGASAVFQLHRGEFLEGSGLLTLNAFSSEQAII